MYEKINFKFFLSNKGGKFAYHLLALLVSAKQHHTTAREPKTKNKGKKDSLVNVVVVVIKASLGTRLNWWLCSPFFKLCFIFFCADVTLFSCIQATLTAYGRQVIGPGTGPLPLLWYFKIFWLLYLWVVPEYHGRKLHICRTSFVEDMVHWVVFITRDGRLAEVSIVNFANIFHSAHYWFDHGIEKTIKRKAIVIVFIIFCWRPKTDRQKKVTTIRLPAANIGIYDIASRRLRLSSSRNVHPVPPVDEPGKNRKPGRPVARVDVRHDVCGCWPNHHHTSNCCRRYSMASRDKSHPS